MPPQWLEIIFPSQYVYFDLKGLISYQLHWLQRRTCILVIPIMSPGRTMLVKLVEGIFQRSGVHAMDIMGQTGIGILTESGKVGAKMDFMPETVLNVAVKTIL